MVRRSFGIGSVFFAAAVLFGAASANAQADVMKACGAEWQKLKADNKVAPGQTWNSYLADCRKAKAAAAPAAPAPAAPAAAAPAAPATPPVASSKVVPPEPGTPEAAKPDTADAKKLTPGQIAARERIKKCGGMWQADKAANKIPAGQKWPQYWSACNKKLKAAGQ